MKHDVTVPQSGESITEVFIGDWRKKTGDLVQKDEVLVDLETQKATFELRAEWGGILQVLAPDRDTVVKPGDRIATIDDSAAGSTDVKAVAETKSPKSESKVVPVLSPSARKIVAEKKIDPTTIKGTGKEGRITKEDALRKTPEPILVDTERGEKREPATRIRRQIAQNLVAAQQTAAILTTFNEVDMTQVLSYRKANKEGFQKKHGIVPGIVSFFAAASVQALKAYPIVNASFTGEEIITRDFVDLSVAVSSDRGLVVPVIRDADRMTIIDFEKSLVQLAEKAREGKLSIPEMTGGTFTISNGGIFGSLLSTPILNMPQSAILGLHKTQERPVVVEGQIVIRPMMYLALSYDHRMIDGREAVLFLVKIKECIENLDLILKGQAI